MTREPKPVFSATTPREVPHDELLALYAQLVLIRRFEERTAELFRAGHIKGTVHSCIGQEAVAVGIGAALRRDDYLVGHHRSHGHLLARGARPDRMMAELLGRRTGYCRGLGGSMHIADMELNILGCNGVVGAGLPLGCGAALSALTRGEDRVALVVFGDGAAGEGMVHEAMNLAAVWKLPVIFVCENNQFALTTRWCDGRAVEQIADRAAAYGMPGVTVDGNDLFAVRDAVAHAIGLARSGGGPTLIEALTYRQLEHSMRANLPDTRDHEEHQRWLMRDPIRRFAMLLEEAGICAADLAAVESRADAVIEEAVGFGMASEPASADDLHPATYAPHAIAYPPPTSASTRNLSMMAAVAEALAQEMAADPLVVLMGEDVRMGGIFRGSVGLYERFGPLRVRDTPISELGYVGAAVGAAMTGLRPVVEIQIFDFVTLAMDAIVNQAAKLRFMLGGAATIPLVVRGPSGGGVRLGAQHSQSLEAWFAHIPGLVVVAPSHPADAKGLLAAAIRDDNPVIFLETKSLLFEEAPVPAERYAIALGTAAVKRVGRDVTVVATQAMVPQAMRAALQLERAGISVEVIDPRTLYPLDTGTILASVRKTGRAVIAHEAPVFMGIGAEIAATISEQAFDYLDAPVMRVGAPHHPMPYASELERRTIPGWQQIVAAVQNLR